MKAGSARKSKSSNSPKNDARDGDKRALHLVITAAIVAVGWLGLVSNTQRHELILDACIVVVLTLFAAQLFRTNWLRLHFEVRDVLQCWRIQWYVLSKCWEITVVLFRDAFLGRRAGSYYRACSFRISRRDPILLARSVLTVAYTTAAPNFIVIGIDADQKQMLFHQIERNSVPRMCQALGAQQGPES